MFQKSALIAAILLLATACESNTSIMDSWIGGSDTALMADWGAHDFESWGGSVRVLTYQGRNSFGRIICRRSFTVNAERVVVAASDNCPF